MLFFPACVCVCVRVCETLYVMFCLAAWTFFWHSGTGSGAAQSSSVSC